MTFELTNHKKLMVIHNLQTDFCLLIATVHTRDFKHIVISADIARLDREIFICVCVCTIPAFGFVGFPLCRCSDFFDTLQQ